MLREIAVFVDDQGKTTDIGKCGRVVVYHRKCGTWQKEQEELVLDDEKSSLSEIRKQMRGLLIFLDTCKVFVASSASGVYYYELEKGNISVWEFSGKPEEFLDYIAASEEVQIAAEKVAPIEVPVPKEIGEGRYTISIKGIQENNTSITSKQVLQSFLQKGNFYSIEILCSHIPPWLEKELLTGKLDSEVTKVNQKEVKVLIKKACCL